MSTTFEAERSVVLSPNSLAASLAQPDEIRLQALARFDEKGRVLVHVHLDGNQSMKAIERALTSLNAKVLDKIENYRHGIVAAYLPSNRSKPWQGRLELAISPQNTLQRHGWVKLLRKALWSCVPIR